MSDTKTTKSTNTQAESENKDKETKKSQEELDKEREKEKEEMQERTARKQEVFLEIFEETAGIISAACKAVGINRSTYYLWIEKYPKFKEKVDLIKDQQVEFVEDKLIQLIHKNDGASVRFYLGRLSPKYSKKIEQTNTDKTLEDLIDKHEKENQETEEETEDADDPIKQKIENESN